MTASSAPSGQPTRGTLHAVVSAAKGRPFTVAVVLTLAALLWFGLSSGRRSASGAPAVAVARGDLTIRLTETGVLRPAQSLTYRSPLAGRTAEIVFLAPEGARVQAGDLVAQLDTTEIDRELEQATQRLRQARIELQVADAEYEEARADVASMVDGEGALGVDEATFSLAMAEKNVEQLHAEYESLAPLLEKGYITREELDRTAFELEHAEGELQLVRRKTELFVERTHPREEQRTRLQLVQREAQLGNANSRLAEVESLVANLGTAIEACRMYARRAGLVVYEENLSSNPRRKVRVGDRVSSTQGIITIPEVSRMFVESSVREADLHRVAPGLPVAVRLDAFPDLRLTGAVVSIGALARSSRIGPFEEKRFEVVVEVDPTDAELRPEMTARLDIMVDERHDVLLVPVNALFDRDGGLVVNIARPLGVETQAVEIGASNDLYAEVVSGLEDGDRVLLLDFAAPAIQDEPASSFQEAPAAASELSPQ